jgi:hypothetical protein
MRCFETYLHGLLTFVEPPIRETPVSNTVLNSATIIPFPARPLPEPEAASKPPVEGTERLTNALANLNKALITQRAAMASWQSALGDLRDATKRLGTSMRTYQSSLATLDGQVQNLRDQAKQLEAWADRQLAQGN